MRSALYSLAGPALAGMICLAVAPFWAPMLLERYGDDLLLRVIWGTLVLAMIVDRNPRRDLPLVVVATLGGLCIEAWGTTTGLWHYFTDERPPAWIVPAWPIAALATERLAGRLAHRLQGVPRWVAWLILPLFTVWMASFLWPSIHIWSSWLVLALMGMVSLRLRRPTRDLSLFVAGSLLGVALEYWGTSRACWTYYTEQTPPLVASCAHGFATVAFARVVDLWERVRWAGPTAGAGLMDGCAAPPDLGPPAR